MIQLATTRRFARWLVGLFLVIATMPAAPRFADAHGIAGNRFFPGTLSFDDPAVADESRLPLFSSSKHPDEGGDVVDNRFSWSFFRLLTPTFGVGIDSGWVQRNWGSSQRFGFDTTSLSVKGEVYRNDLHEMLVSAALSWAIGHSGAQGVGANGPDAILPGIFFGKGFGDLPDSLAWLRPFGITGAVTLEHPMTGSSINFGVDALTGQLAPMLTRNVDILHWGFALEFSTLYLTRRFTPGKLPKEEPLNQFVPLVEFFIRLAARTKDRCDDEPGAVIRGRELAGRGGSDRAAQQRGRTFHRRQGTAAFVPARPYTVGVRKVAPGRLMTAAPLITPRGTSGIVTTKA